MLLVALTFRDGDPLAARGAISAFWQAYRAKVPGAKYFSWAELQLRGAVHYHALIVDPPWVLQRTARRWVQAHWPHADIQPSVQFRDRAWFNDRGLRYVTDYAKKSDAKSYQQDYDELIPKEIRTFESNQLEHLVDQLDAHLDGTVVEYRGPTSAPWWIRLEFYFLMQYLHHLPAPGGCRIPVKTKKRRRGQSSGRPRRLERTDSASTTVNGLGA